MLKLLIVDDERLVRQLIQMCVDWEEIGFTVVGTAATAEEGLEKVEELHPDVLFTDVRMPGQTGLDLARTVVERYPSIKVVVISGYDEFAYVNEGLKIGIFDYLLKPISEEALQQTGCKVRDAILEERRHNEEFQRYKREFEQNYKAIREKNISRLVYSQNVELVAENLKVFGIELQEACFQAAVLEYSFGEEFGSEEELITSFQAREILEAFFRQYSHIYFFERSYPYIVMLNNEMQSGFEALCRELCKVLADQGLFVRIGIGGFYRDLRQLSVSYREAKTALTYGFTKKSGECISISELPEKETDDSWLKKNQIQNYAYYIGQGMIPEAKNQIREIYSSLRGQVLSRDQAIFQTANLVIETYAAAGELHISAEELEQGRMSTLARVLQIHDLEEMEQCVLELLDRLMLAFRRKNEEHNSGVVETVEDYIQENYFYPDISLAQMAQMVYVNPNYLSRAFKKKTGKTFREYLQDLRMEKAMVLLRNTALKAYEVAEKVGIRDPNYFSVCFKKKFGYSVQDLDRSGTEAKTDGT